MMKPPVKTNDIELFMGKLANLFHRPKDEILTNYCDDDNLRELFAGTTEDEQHSIVEFIEHLFRGFSKIFQNFLSFIFHDTFLLKKSKLASGM